MFALKRSSWAEKRDSGSNTSTRGDGGDGGGDGGGRRGGDDV
jgi:hypothetical protein